MLIVCLNDLLGIKSVPYKYVTCSNITGVENTCKTWARFSDKDSCEDYKTLVWQDKNPPRIMLVYCSE